MKKEKKLKKLKIEKIIRKKQKVDPPPLDTKILVSIAFGYVLHEEK